DDVELMCQRAQVLSDLGRARESSEALDRAVTKFPQEALPYLRRARAAMGDPARAGDVLADLNTAIKLNPAVLQALRMRAQVSMRNARYEEAIKDLQAAVDAAPILDELRWELVSLLLNQNREADAVAATDAGARVHPSDLNYLAAAADQYVKNGR